MMSIPIYAFAAIGMGVTVAALILGVYRLASDFVDAHTEGLEFRIAHLEGAIIQAQIDIDNIHGGRKHQTQAITELEEYGRETRKDSEEGFGALTLEIADIRERLAMIERTLAA